MAPKEKARLIDLATYKPSIRKRNIDAAIRNVGWNNDGILKEFGLQVSSAPVAAVARVLPPPALLFKEDISVPENGKWAPEKVQFHEVGPASSV